MSSFRSQLDGYVGMCDRHILRGRLAIAKQRTTIATLLEDGREARLAKVLLVSLLDSQRLHEEHRQRLLRVIDSAVD